MPIQEAIHRSRSPSPEIGSESSPFEVGSLDRIDAAFAYYRHLNRARSYVEQHSLGSVKLPDVAAAIGISPSRLAHLFRDKIGTTFSAWLAVQQISKAITILRKQDMPIAEVAGLTGFCSYRSFQRAFKKITGQTPASYKKLVRNF